MKRKTKNMILAIAISVVAIFFPAWLFDKWFEGVIFFICHWLIREQYPRQYHHIIPATCRLITSVTFFFGVSFILPFTLSLISAIPINYFIGWVGFTKKNEEYYEYKYEKLKAQLENKMPFSTDTCTEAELIARCNELRMKKDDINLAIEFFICRTPRKELAEKYCVETEAIKKRKQRMKEKLNRQ